MKDDAPSTPARRGGRPSRFEAEQLGEKILQVATDLFLANGYGATSIEAVAERARISKRTFYHRFPDKPALFGAVVHRIIQNSHPPAGAELFEGGSLDEILRHIAILMLRAAITPSVLALHRLIVAEALRFPELAVALAEEGTTAWAVDNIATLLERAEKKGSIQMNHKIFAASQFIQLVIAIPQRRALGLGTPMTPVKCDAWAKDAVDLFLNGCRGSNSQGEIIEA